MDSGGASQETSLPSLYILDRGPARMWAVGQKIPKFMGIGLSQPGEKCPIR